MYHRFPSSLQSITELVEPKTIHNTVLTGNNSAFKTRGRVVQIVISRGGQMMRPKILIAVGLVLAFVVGTLASGIYTTTTRAFTPAVETNTVATVAPVHSFRG